MKDNKIDRPYSTPIILPEQEVLKEWLDYNGHMNLAFYIHLFDSSWEVLLEKFNIGEDSAKIENYGQNVLNNVTLELKKYI